MSDLPPPPVASGTFEYEYIELPSNATRDDVLNALNTAGAEGWQVVGFSSAGGFHRILMVRQTS